MRAFPGTRDVLPPRRPAERPDRAADRAAILFVVVFFAASRLLFAAAGARFDARPLLEFCQFLDGDLLRHRLAESLAYLHIQPPLFNLYVGVVLKVAPGSEGALFSVLQLALGLALSLLLFRFLRSLGASPAAGALLATLFAAGPSALLYEKWLFYELPVGALLLLAAFCLGRFLRHGALFWGVLFFTSAAAVTWTRSLFHVVWLGLLMLLLAAQARRPRLVLAAASGPVVLTIALCAKNAILFGFFGTSSWLGMSLARGTTFALPLVEREALISAGDLSPFARVPTRPAFPDVRDLPVHASTPPTGIPALDQVRRPGGASNHNNLLWVGVSEAYLRDARTVLAAHPATWLLSIGEALTLYFRPSCEDPLLLAGNRRALAAWETVYDRFVLLDHGISWTLFLVHVTALAWGGWFVLARRLPATEVERGLVLFAWVTLLWVAAVGNLLEVGENNRFRWAVDPLALGLAVHAVRCLAATGRRRPGLPAGEGPSGEVHAGDRVRVRRWL